MKVFSYKMNCSLVWFLLISRGLSLLLTLIGCNVFRTTRALWVVYHTSENKNAWWLLWKVRDKELSVCVCVFFYELIITTFLSTETTFWLWIFRFALFRINTVVKIHTSDKSKYLGLESKIAIWSKYII
jgi:hypothetical protein